jgi:hypothetical protein
MDEHRDWHSLGLLMAKLLTTLQHPDQLINRIQDGIVQTVNPLLKAWYDRFSIPGDCSGTLIAQRVTLADDWIDATALLAGTWVPYQSPPTTYCSARYRKRSGLVEIGGMVKNGTVPSTIFPLPVGYRPQWRVLFVENSNSAPGYLGVYQDGVVECRGGDATWFHLQCMFAPLDPSPVPNPVFPLTLAHGLKPGKIPTTVLLADAVDTATLEHVSSSCSWRAYDETHVQIIDLPGLFATRTYDLTFLVLGG